MLESLLCVGFCVMVFIVCRVVCKSLYLDRVVCNSLYCV